MTGNIWNQVTEVDPWSSEASTNSRSVDPGRRQQLNSEGVHVNPWNWEASTNRSMDPSRRQQLNSKVGSSVSNTGASFYEQRKQLQSVFDSNFGLAGSASDTFATQEYLNSRVGSSGSITGSNFYDQGKQQQLQSVVDCKCGLVDSTGDTFAIQEHPTLLHWDYCPSAPAGGHLNASWDDAEFKDVGTFVLGNQTLDSSCAVFLRNCSELVEDRFSEIGYPAWECSFQGETFIHDLSYLSEEAYGEAQSQFAELPMGILDLDVGLDFEFSDYPSNLATGDFWPPYSFSANFPDEDPMTICQSSLSGVDFQENCMIPVGFDLLQKPGENSNKNCLLETEFESKPFAMFDPIQLNEANRYHQIQIPMMVPDVALEGTASCNVGIDVDGTGADSKSMVQSLSVFEGLHELKVTGSCQNGLVIAYNTESISDSIDLQAQAQMMRGEVNGDPNAQHMILTAASLQPQYDQNREEGNSNSVLSACTASTNESRIGGQEVQGALTDEEINWVNEKDLIISKMLGKRDAMNVSDEVNGVVKGIVQTFEDYWKRDGSDGKLEPRQDRSLINFQREITITINSFCERERRRVRYLPDFCKRALSDWVSTDAHQQNPYPEKREIRGLASELGLTSTQVTSRSTK
ncbi:hypothetical protein R1flu_023841 [Riccia fluitans]|uniref:Uncharacterized protein n=1 Tax=Riccia fluitans TaxID=41844 RepID=A0ABD1XTN5_9MARC